MPHPKTRFSGIVANTTASRIRNVRCKYIGAFVVSVNDVAVFTAASILDVLRAAATSDNPLFKIFFDPDRFIPVTDRHLDQSLHLTVDQLSTISVITSSSPVSASVVDNVFSPIASESLTTISLNFCFVRSIRRHMERPRSKVLEALLDGTSTPPQLARMARFRI